MLLTGFQKQKNKGKPKPITDVKMAVCREFMENGFDKVAAIRKHMPHVNTWKDASVHSHAGRLFNEAAVVAYLNDLRTKIRIRAEEKLAISSDRILREWARVAFGDVRKIFDENGFLIMPKNLDDDTAAFVSSIDVTALSAQDGANVPVSAIIKIKMHDKLKALESLTKYLGLYDRKAPDSDDTDKCRLAGAKVPEWMRDLIPKAGE